MLTSTKIQRRQSEIREALSGLAAKDAPTEDETRQMTDLDAEYRANEARYRAALIAEDTERREAGKDLETRSDREWSDLLGQYEVRQAVMHLDEGHALNGATAEIVSELRAKGGFRGVPLPYDALEVRTGETVASGIPDPVSTRSIIDRLFPASVAGRMGAQMVNIGVGETEYPVTTSSVSAGWASSETGAVATPTAYATTDRSLKPDQNLGVQMKITRRAMKSAAGIEAAVRRDMRGAIQTEMDKAVFQGAGSSGEPLGVIAGAGTYGITSTSVAAAVTWSAFRTAVVAFMNANAVSSPSGVRCLIRPEIWDALDGTVFDTGSGLTEWDRMVKHIPAGNIAMSANALAAPTGSPTASKALLTTTVGGVSPIIVATWGAIDLIRDPFSDATSGGLRLTALVTLDVTVTRTAQLRVLTGLQD
jgi:HK97 family phage major capsid protein